MKHVDNIYFEALVGFYHGMQEWFNGSTPNTDEAFAQTINVVADDNVYIRSDGRLHPSGKDFLKGMRQAHGQMPDFKMWVDDLSLSWEIDNLALVTYKEWSKTDGNPPRGLRSTAIFRKNLDKSNGIEWIHYQETPLSET